jgi:hypothetical protein
VVLLKRGLSREERRYGLFRILRNNSRNNQQAKTHWLKVEMSELLGLDSKVWDNVYDWLLGNQNIPEQTQQTLREHQQLIHEIYGKVRGKWWITGTFWQKFYRIENRFGKMAYELRQELKAIHILQKDMKLVEPFFASNLSSKPKVLHSLFFTRVVDE